MKNCQNHDSQDLQISRIDNAMQHELLTRRVIGCAMNVHRTLGNGFQEVIYQKALEIRDSTEELYSTSIAKMPLVPDSFV